MRDIKLIPEVELRADLAESKQDIIACRDAISKGVILSCGTKIVDRLNDNKYFVMVITAELHRRGLIETE